MRSALVIGVAMFAAAASPCPAQCAQAPSVTNLGAGTPGTNGVARLSSALPLVGQPFELRVTYGLANSNGGILVSGATVPLYLPMFDALLLPALPALSDSFVFDPNGNSPPLIRLTPAPAGLCGGQFTAQAVFLDPVAKGFVAFTNGVELRFGAPQIPVLDPLPRVVATAGVVVSGRGSAAGNKVFVEGGASIVQSTVGANSLFSVNVPLRANRLNRLFVTQEVAGVRSAPAAIDVVQDTEPPAVFIDAPVANAVMPTATIDVAGRVSDQLSGFAGLSVTVNGRTAIVNQGIGTNGTFEVTGLPINTTGSTVITATATDAVGNQATSVPVTVTYQAPTGTRMTAVSGNAQTGQVLTALPNPLVVKLTLANGAPFVGKVVDFAVTRSDGRLRAQPTDPGALSISVLTDANGEARATWRLGSDAGCGNNRVTVTSKDVAGAVYFCASATAAPADRILVGAGGLQTAAIYGCPPEPLRAWVSDGCNGVANVPVTFRITRGSGSLSAPGVTNGSTATVPTAPTGHAEVVLALGSVPETYEVEADFAGNPGLPATFVVYALAAARSTRLSGIVLDNSQQPIEGATCELVIGVQQPVQTTTDADGRFALTSLTGAGLASLHVDGATATKVGGQAINPANLRFPALHFEPYLAENADNVLPTPVLLPRMDPTNDVVYDGTATVELRCAGVEGLRMIVAAGTTVRLPDGTVASPATPVTLALNQVFADDVPMPMPDGASPPFAWTLQPAGATFSPPVQVVYPNMTGLPAGAITYFLSFDHDTQRFEIVASGSVCADGSCSTTDPGSGISTAGWGCLCPPYLRRGDCERDTCPEILAKFAQNLANKAGTAAAGLARQLDCLARNGWGVYGPKVDTTLKVIADNFDQLGQPSNFFETVDQLCNRIPTPWWLPFGSNLKDACFVVAGTGHALHELWPAFTLLCAQGTPLYPWDHIPFLYGTLVPCMLGNGDLSLGMRLLASLSVPAIAGALRDLTLAQWFLVNLFDDGIACNNFNYPTLPPRLTQAQLSNPAISAALPLEITEVNGKFFLDIGAQHQMKVTKTLAGGTKVDLTAASTGTTYFLMAPLQVGSIGPDGLVDVVRTTNPVPTMTPVIWVLAANGSDFGIGQFAIQDVDTDGDQIVDSYERFFGLDPNARNALDCDSDLDGIADHAEVMVGTHPMMADSDGDGVRDGTEMLQNSLALWQTSFAPSLGTGCVASVNGQTVRVESNGGFRIRNIAADGSIVRADLVCTLPDGTSYGASAGFQIQAGATTPIAPVPLRGPQPRVVALRALPDTSSLTPPSVPSTQVRVTGTLADGTTRDLTLPSAWTTYVSSNPQVATVSASGLVTAVGRGTAMISVRNEGATAVARILVSPGDPGTTVVGFAKLADGTPVQNATATIAGQTASATTGSDGRFVIPAVLSLLGPIDVSVTIVLGGQTLRGTSGPVEPVPGGLTDAGCIVVETKSEVLVVHGGGAIPCVNPGNSTLSVLEPSSNSVLTSVDLGADTADIASTVDGGIAVTSNLCSSSIAFWDVNARPPVLLGSLTVPFQGSQIEVTSTGFALLTDPAGGANVLSVDVATRATVSTLSVPAGIHRVLPTLDGAHGIAISNGSNVLRVLTISPTGQLANTGQSPNNGTGGTPFTIAIAPGGSLVLTGNNDQTVSVLDFVGGTLTYRRSLTVAQNPFHSCQSIGFRGDGRKAWVLLGDLLSFTTREVLGLDVDAAGNVTSTGVRIGGIDAAFRDAMAIADGGSRILVPVNNRTLVIDAVANRIAGSVPTAGPARAIAVRGR